MKMNPFFDICDSQGTELEGSIFGTAFGGMNEPAAPRVSDIEVTVSVTLREIYNGSKKCVRYQRQVVGLDGRTVKTETASVDMIVCPGMLDQAVLTYCGKGNQQPK